MLGLAIGAAMCYPGIQLSALSAGAEAVTTVLEGTLFQSPVYIDFFGIPVIFGRLYGNGDPGHTDCMVCVEV